MFINPEENEMATAAKVAEWTALVEGDGYKITEKGNIFVACGRCGGHGSFACFGHIEQGICFGCGGSKGRFVSLQGLAGKIRRRKALPGKKEAKLKASLVAARLEAIEFLHTHPQLHVALKGADHKIVRDIAKKLLQWGSISQKQMDFVFKLRIEEAEKAALPEVALIALPEGRVEIQGKIISIKEVAGFAYNSFDLKMLVQVETPEGNFRAYGTLPGAIVHAEKGETVKFTATFETKEPGFGFFKRPTKSSIVEEAVCG